MNKKEFEAARRIVIYLSKDEARHWEESGKPKKHIYKDVLKLAKYLDEVIKKCAFCGELMHVLVHAHSHTENGKDVTV